MATTAEDVTDAVTYALEDLFYAKVGSVEPIQSAACMTMRLAPDALLLAYWDAETQQYSMWRVAIDAMPQAEPPAWFREAVERR